MSVLTVAASSIRQKLANNIESAIAKQATEMGSLVVHDTRAIGPSTGLSGWDFVSDAERLMFSVS